MFFMARPERFELPTAWFVARYSIQLSYGRIFLAVLLSCRGRNRFVLWRRGRDSNPRRGISPYSLSRGALSTTQPPLRITQIVGNTVSLKTLPLALHRALTRDILSLALRAALPSKFAPGEFVDHSATSPIYSNCCQKPTIVPDGGRA